MSTQVVSVDDGYLVYSKISLASTNSTLVKGSAGRLMGWYISNINASPMTVKIYDKATAPTVGTDIPVLRLTIPGNATGAGSNLGLKDGINFNLGIGFGITTASADNSTSAVAASDVIVNLLYK